MNGLAELVRENPYIFLFITFIATLGGLMSIVLNWNKFYDVIQKPVTLPAWLPVLVLSVFCCIFLFMFYSSSAPNKEDNSPKEYQAVQNKNFGVQQIILDGKNFIDCVFDGSELIYTGEMGFGLVGCQYPKGFRFVVRGAASNTLNMLTIMHKDPALKEFIERTLDNIKSGSHKQATTINDNIE